MSHIELSVAMIFKNEIRCLERCLKSLQPLRERFSMELVMADTGSSDGSRAVAEQYADILFDFPWVNDFAAARNATLDRCSGDWTLILDCDEWLDAAAPAALEKLLRGNAAAGCDGALVWQRNYKSYACDRNYSDAPVLRVARMASRSRFRGRIHEVLAVEGRNMVLYPSGLVLHHDGYAAVSAEQGREKLRRNMALLRAEVAEEPDNLLRWTQITDSCAAEPDCMELVAHAARLVEERKPGWRRYGAPILRRAAQHAYNKKLPETLSWTEKARRLFPDSYFTRIDVRRIEMLCHGHNQDYAACVASGEAYLRGCAALRREKRVPEELTAAPLESASPMIEEGVRVRVAELHRLLGHDARALAHYKKVDWSVLAPSALSRTLEASAALFLPLRGKCLLGNCAAVLDARTEEEADAALAAVEDLEALPPAVFLHALKTGADFPIPGRNLTEAQFDALAEKLAADRTFLLELARFAADAAETVPELLWARSLARAALKQR